MGADGTVSGARDTLSPGELLLKDFSAGGEKDLLLEKMMPKRRDILEKLLALVLLAYGIGVLEGFGGCEEKDLSPVVTIFL